MPRARAMRRKIGSALKGKPEADQIPSPWATRRVKGISHPPSMFSSYRTLAALIAVSRLSFLPEATAFPVTALGA